MTEPPVAGDDYVRFVRRVRPDSAGGGVDDRLEGMTWGRLTSGAVTQALWLLLLPFALVNMAYWARPWDASLPEGDAHPCHARAAAAYRWLVRALGLSLTITTVFAAASASMDLLGWQCAISQREACVSVHGWLSFTASWTPGAVLATAALLPALLVLVLAALSFRTTLRYESFHGAGEEGQGGDDPHLFSRRMWRGDLLVSRLRALHVATGLAVVAVVVAESARGLGEGVVDVMAQAALALSALTILTALALATPSAWVRWSDLGLDPRPWTGPAIRVAGILALLLAGTALLSSGESPVRPDRLDPGRTAPAQHLPGIIGLGQGIVLAQIALLIALLVTMIWARCRLGPDFGRPTPVRSRSSDKADDDKADDDKADDDNDNEAERLRRTEDPPRLALKGFAGWFIAAMSILLGFAYSSAVMFRVAGVFTGSVSKGACEQCATYATTIEPAPAFEIAAFGTGLFLVVLLVLVVVLVMGIRSRRKQALDWVREEYADELGRMAPPAISERDYRVTRVVRPLALASAVSLDRFGAILVSACVVGIVSGLYSGWDAIVGLGAPPGAAPDPLRPTFGSEGPPVWVRTAFDTLRDLGAWAAAGLVVGFLALGVLAWRSPTARRMIGIIWDVVSFWPRAGHPLAPPCYAERAVPQLTSRLSYLVAPQDGQVGQDGQDGQGRKVVLAGHSQGSVIAVAAVAQMRGGREVDQVSLLTFGSPLMRLYAPIFPRLFWPTRLADLPVAEGQRWTSLWRRTDPVGATMQPLLRPAITVEETPLRGDLRLKDPLQLSMVARVSAYPNVYGHHDYHVDRFYQRALGRLADATPD